jgi:hypothetical protein
LSILPSDRSFLGFLKKWLFESVRLFIRRRRPIVHSGIIHNVVIVIAFTFSSARGFIGDTGNFNLSLFGSFNPCVYEKEKTNRACGNSTGGGNALTFLSVHRYIGDTDLIPSMVQYRNNSPARYLMPPKLQAVLLH